MTLSFNNKNKDIIGSKNNKPINGSQSISKIAPTIALLYTLIPFVNHQYPEAMMLEIKTILLVFEFLKGGKFSFINVYSIVMKRLYKILVFHFSYSMKKHIDLDLTNIQNVKDNSNGLQCLIIFSLSIKTFANN